MAAPLPESDGDLVLLALEGRQDAFSALYERYFPSVFDFLTRLLRNREEAADVAQDTFIKALEQLPSLNNPDRFKSWLFTIAHRTGLNRIRSSKRTATVGGAVDDDERATMAVADADPTVDPEQMAAIQEAADIVWEAAAGLDPRTYTVMDLHVRQGLDSAEIAEVMGVTKGNAYTMVSRMKQSFSNTLATYLLVRKGRADCDDLATIISHDVEKMTPELRKKADRHVSKCNICSENKAIYFEPVKMFAALMLVPVPLGLKAAIWGTVAAAGAGAAGVGAATVAATQAGGATAGAGAQTAGAASGSAGAGGSSAATIGAIAAAVALTVAIATGGWLIARSPGPETVAAAAVTTTADAGSGTIPQVPSTPTPAPEPTPDPPATTTTVPPTTTTTAPSNIAGPLPTDPPPAPPPPPELVVIGDTSSTDEDVAVAVDVLANDSGPLDPTTLQLAAAPSHGSAVASDDGVITYTPATNYAGLDELTYSVADDLGRSASGVLTVSVLPVNDEPQVPGPGPVTMDEDGTYSFDPLDGAVDVDGDPLVMTAFDALSAAGGTVVEGSLIYTPPPNFSGTDTFSYTVSDDTTSVKVLVSVDVAPVADPPSAPSGSASLEVAEDETGTVDLLAGWSDADGDTLSVDAGTFATAEDGIVVIDADGTAEYTPAANFFGDDSFPYVVTDGDHDVGATAEVTVSPVNDAPVVADTTFSVPENSPPGTAVGTLVATDADGDSVTFAPAAGAVVLEADGSLTLVEDVDHEATPVLELDTVASDGNGGETKVAVTIEITNVNEAPTVQPASFSFNAGVGTNEVIGTVVASDPDAGDVLSYAIIAGDSQGQMAINSATGDLTVPNLVDASAFPLTLTVEVVDGGGLTASAQVTVDLVDLDGPVVGAFMAAPTVIFSAPASGGSCAAGPTITTLTANVADPSGIASVEFGYSGRILGSPLEGSIPGTHVNDVASATFGILYNGPANFNEDFTFTITATDTEGNSTTVAGVTVTVRKCP